MAEKDERKVWVAWVPDGDEYNIGPCEVLIEQFGDAPPTVAFRRKSEHVWARPWKSEAR